MLTGWSRKFIPKTRRCITKWAISDFYIGRQGQWCSLKICSGVNGKPYAAFTPCRTHVARKRIPNEQLVSGYMSMDTCRRIPVARPGYLWTVSWRHNYYSFHLCHGRLVSLVSSNRRATNCMATILSPIQDTCRRRQVDIQVDITCIRQHVSWCKRGFISNVAFHFFCHTHLPISDLQIMYFHGVLLFFADLP